MVNITYKLKRESSDMPWVVWFEPYAEEVFTEQEIKAYILPTREGLLNFEGFKGITVTEPDDKTLIATVTFDTISQAQQAKIWLGERVDRIGFIRNKKNTSMFSGSLHITVT